MSRAVLKRWYFAVKQYKTLSFGVLPAGAVCTTLSASGFLQVRKSHAIKPPPPPRWGNGTTGWVFLSPTTAPNASDHHSCCTWLHSRV